MTPKQRAFVGEYLVDLNATGAAKRAGYSPRTATQIGEHNLRKVDIAGAIKLAIDARAERTGITADNVLRELASIGFSNIRALFTDAGQLRRIEDLEESVSGSIQSIEVVVRRGGDDGAAEHTAKIKLWDKLAALEKMGRHLGMFTEKIEMTTAGPTQAQIEESAQKFDQKMRQLMQQVDEA